MIFNYFLSDLTENGRTKVMGSALFELDHVEHTIAMIKQSNGYSIRLQKS
jgi:hypothetical protein